METTWHKKSTIIMVYISSITIPIICIIAAIIYYPTILFYIFGVVALLFIALYYFSIKETKTSKFIIDKNGVNVLFRRKIYFIEWKHIRMVAASKLGLGKATVIILFSTKHDPKLLDIIPNHHWLSNQFVYTQNRKGLILEIKKHWDGDIINGEKYEC